ncbi:MAG: hypothetical protein U5L72_15695 [Bacteroidales bacterium]|nr:hypothetical protein [Bacteroidales bacterium]
MKRYISMITPLLLTCLLIPGCKKDEPDPPIVIKEATDVNKFIYNTLATYYLWEDDISALNNPKYENSDSLNVFLNRYTDPEALFDDLLYTKDKWSFIVDNAEEIENWINAISESVGMDFRLYYISSTSNNLIGVIRYVLHGSPAELAGLKRGDSFMTVNGEQLTDANYMTLLFTLKNYTLGLASFNGGNPAPNGNTVNLTAVLLQENPVLP